MSWLLNLYETYESNIDRIGEAYKKPNGQEYTLLPISHTTQTAHIEVQITEEGEFHSASVVDKSDAITVIPCTDESASRSGSKIAPYPLHDKLSYVAGDFVKYGGKVKKDEPFTHYIKQLKDWSESQYATSKVKSIYAYLKKRQLIKDLVSAGILFLDADGKLISKWDKKYEGLYGEKPKIFSVLTSGQESAFIRFNVYSPHKILTPVWKDKKMYESFINFYRDSSKNVDICYITGKNAATTERHANKIRNSADKAKLISSNDKYGFTYRGRFINSSQAVSISYEASQKAHNALKWLINRQSKIIDNRVFLVWGNDELDVPDYNHDSYDLSALLGLENQSRKIISFTNQEFAKEVAKALDGYKSNLNTDSKVNILILDSATTGRLAVLYYRNMDIDFYLDRLKNWHSTCVWLHHYRKDKKGNYIPFFGAPATKDIAFAAYGPNANNKVIKGLMERMLPCIVDGQKIPVDILRSAFYRASNPVAMDKWEWEKTLSITCALINKEEGYELALDKENVDRDYLFGRLLAIADVLERRALGPEVNRATNAIRYMNSFSNHPARTWKIIQESIQPYQMRLGRKGQYLSGLIDEVASKIKFEDFNDKPLSGKYLLGFYSQRYDLYQKKDYKNSDNTTKGEIE